MANLYQAFRKKNNAFNNHFTSQCTPVKNSSKLPNFKYKSDKRLTFLEINEYDIVLIIRNKDKS